MIKKVDTGRYAQTSRPAAAGLILYTIAFHPGR